MSVPNSAHNASGPPPSEALDEQIEISAGRRAPYTQLADWVALSGVSDHAKALYWHLKMHVNVERGDGEVWPRKELLAGWMGLSRADKIDPYIAELLALGAIEVYKRRHSSGLRARNRYVVHDTPPPNYAGPTSLAEWYSRNRAKESVSAGRSVTPSRGSRSPVQGTTARPKSSRVSAGHSVSPPRGVRTPAEGMSVAPSRGLEQDEVQLDESSSSSCITGRAGAARHHRPQEEEARARAKRTGSEAAPDDEVSRQAREVVDAATMEWPREHRRPTAPERLRLTERVAEALVEGASTDVIMQALTRDLRPSQVRTTAVQVVMGRTGRPGWAEGAPVPAPRPEPPRCPQHPGSGLRGSECAACWADRVAVNDGESTGQHDEIEDMEVLEVIDLTEGVTDPTA